MLRQFNRLIALALLISVTIYITLTNSETATLKIGPNIKVTTFAGVIYLGVFFCGCVVASLFALFVGLKGYLRERKLRAAARSHQEFFDLFIKGRSFMASADWIAARSVWEQILAHDAENPIALVELANCYENLGEMREALRVLDSMRVSNQLSPAVLLKAVEINRSLGNLTAASDNLKLLVQDSPTKRTLEMARDLAEELGRVEDALDYQGALEKLGGKTEQSIAARTRLTYLQLTRTVENSTSLREALTIFVKKNKSYAPALERLAELEIESGRFEEGAELLVRSAKLTPRDLSKWDRIIDLWLQSAPADFQRRADRALAAARSATQGGQGLERIEAELIVAKTMIAINRLEDARSLLDGLQDLAKKERVELPKQYLQDIYHLTGLCLSRLGLAKETAKLWEELVHEDLPATKASPRAAISGRSEPSPALSTP